MSLSPREIETLVSSTNQRLVDGKIQKIFEANPNTVVFQIRVPGETLNLLFGVDLDLPRFHFINEKPSQPGTPTPFTMACRKHLTGRFDPLSCVGTDRILSWQVGDHRLIAELTNHATLVVVSEDDVVIAHTPNAPARIVSGSTYAGPPARDDSNTDDRFDGDLDRAASYFVAEAARREVDALRTTLLKALRSARKRKRRLIKNLESDLAQCIDAESFQQYGTLLQQAFSEDLAGADHVTVTNYYDPALGTIDIPIDPSKDLKQNVDRYFHQYKRLTAAFERVSERLTSVEEEVAEIEKALALAEGASAEALTTAYREAERRGWVVRKQERQKRGKPKVQLPYREFEAQSGVKIWVGRGAKHNDALTTKFTRGKDVWMHARDWAGAHVVLKTTLADANSEDLIDAAVLAAHFSKGCNDSLVEVSYTEGKHVRKPKGAAPGLVTVSGGKTLVVKPDDPRLSRLLGRE